MKDHVRIGVDILSPLRHIERVVGFVRDHHERWDGNGYPHTRSAEGISIGGRILAAADSFDALVSRRPYRDPLTPDEAIDRLREDSGRQFDPRVFEALRAVVKRRRTMVFVDQIKS